MWLLKKVFIIISIIFSLSAIFLPYLHINTVNEEFIRASHSMFQLKKDLLNETIDLNKVGNLSYEKKFDDYFIRINDQQVTCMGNIIFESEFPKVSSQKQRKFSKAKFSKASSQKRVLKSEFSKVSSQMRVLKSKFSNSLGSQEPVLKSQFSRASSQEPVLKSQFSRASSQEPVRKSQFSRASSQEPVLKSQFSRASSQEPVLKSKFSKASSQK
jgi:hypothetical protein